MTNWSLLVTNRYNRKNLALFASGQKSGRAFYEEYAGGELGGTVRNLLKENGVDRARNLAKKALRRRGVSV